MEETKPSDDFARGAEAMREALAVLTCRHCSAGSERVSGSGLNRWYLKDYETYHIIGTTEYLCAGAALRAFPLPTPDGRRYRVTEEGETAPTLRSPGRATTPGSPRRCSPFRDRLAVRGRARGGEDPGRHTRRQRDVLRAVGEHAEEADRACPQRRGRGVRGGGESMSDKVFWLEQRYVVPVVASSVDEAEHMAFNLRTDIARECPVNAYEWSGRIEDRDGWLGCLPYGRDDGKTVDQWEPGAYGVAPLPSPPKVEAGK